MQQPNNFSPANIGYQPQVSPFQSPPPLVQTQPQAINGSTRVNTGGSVSAPNIPPAQTNVLEQIANVLPPLDITPKSSNPHKTSLLMTIFIWIITAVVFFFVGFLTHMWYANYQSQHASLDLPTDTNQSTQAEEFDYTTWQTYVNSELGLGLQYPQGWKVDLIKTPPVSGCTAFDITVSNTSGYAIKISSPCESSEQACEYGDTNSTSIPQNYEIIKFNTFIEIVKNGLVYRRTATNDKNQVGYTVCQQMQANENFSTFVRPFGLIKYTTPEKVDNEAIITDLDRILFSISNNPISVPTTTPNLNIQTSPSLTISPTPGV
ncbi:MAG: hypothetical protein WCJ58_00410 [bacterium]